MVCDEGVRYLINLGQIIDCIRKGKTSNVWVCVDYINVWCVSFINVQIINCVRRGKTLNVLRVSFLKVQIIDVSGGGRH